MRYGSNDVLHGVNFTIRRGEVLVLLGPNGAGKTTTIEILEGFRVPSAGEVTVLGAEPGDGRRGMALPDRRRPAVLARPRSLAGLGSAGSPRLVLPAVFHHRTGRGRTRPTS